MRTLLDTPDDIGNELFNERTFYKEFSRDLRTCTSEIVIESPFITSKRINMLLPEIRLLIGHGVHTIINTRDPREHDAYMKSEAEYTLDQLHELGAIILYTGSLHRKLAIIDRKVLREGSLNSLSQNDRREIMQGPSSEELALQMIQFVRLNQYL